MKKFLPAIAMALIIITTSCFAQNKSIELKFNLPNGAGYDYDMSMNINTKVNAGGEDVNVNNTMGVGYHFNVLGDSAGWKKMSSTISKIVMNINTGGVNINYDSDKPVDTADVTSTTLGKVLGAMKGAQFTFTMNDKGDIGSVSGIHEMMNNMKASADDGSGGMAEGLGNAFNEDNFKQNLKQAFGMYPGKPVKTGDTWTITTTTATAGMDMKMDNLYTLTSVTGDIANVKVNSKMSSSSADSVSNLDGNMTGVMKFDIPTGVPVDGDLNMILNMTINNGGQSMPVNTDIKMKITGKKS